MGSAATGVLATLGIPIPGARLVGGLAGAYGGGLLGQWIYNTLNDMGLINTNFDPVRPQSNPNANMIHPPHSPGPVVLPNNEIPTGGNIFPTNDDCPLALD